MGGASSRPSGRSSAAGPGAQARPRGRQLSQGLATSLATILVVPQTLAGLERLLTAWTGVWSRVRVGPLVRPYRCRVFKSFATDSALLT